MAGRTKPHDTFCSNNPLFFVRILRPAARLFPPWSVHVVPTPGLFRSRLLFDSFFIHAVTPSRVQPFVSAVFEIKHLLADSSIFLPRFEY